MAARLIGMRSRSSTSRARRTRLLTFAMLAVTALLSACSSRSTPIAEPRTMTEIDGVMGRRIDDHGLDGAALLVVVDGETERDRGYGSFGTDTVIPIASASKWLTAATMLTLVDDGSVSLEDTVAMHLPQFTGTTGSATIRQLLSHTSGIASASCIWNERTSMADCVDSIATSPASYSPGTEFAYGNTSYSVAGRIIEVVTGESFEQAFQHRIAEPLGMDRTRFEGGSNPVPAASAESTLADYGRFVAMLAADGEFEGRRILSPTSARATEVDAVVGLDTTGDAAVRVTGIPTYGLGAWRDIVDANDIGVVTSGNGAYGFYPWIDRVRDAHGVIAVYDTRGSELAVPESQRLLHQILAVLDREHGAPSTPGTTVYRR